MKASNLQGEYCQSCATILGEVQRERRRVIVLDSQCVAVFQQSGDYARLEENLKEPQSQFSKDVEETVEKLQEPVVEPELAKPEPKKAPAKAVKHSGGKKR